MTKSSSLAKHELDSAASSTDELMSNDNTGLCTLCGLKTVYKCDRCGDFYCSELCQRKDWQSHRYICFPMPKLVKAGQNSLQNNIVRDDPPQHQKFSNELKTSTNTSMPPNESCVILTAFKSSNRCFIRSTNPSISVEYQKILDEINDFGKGASTLNEKPKPNSYALALRGKMWCRVQILINRKHSQYRISFVDYGDITKRNLKELRKITPTIANLPCFIHMVQLKGVTKYSIDTKLLNSLTQYTNKEYKIKFVQPDEAGGNAELYFWGNNTLLNSLILSSCNAFKDNEMEQVSVTSSLSNDNNTQNNGLDKTSLKGNHSRTVESIEQQNKNEINDNENAVIPISMTQKRKSAVSPRQIQMQKPCLVPPFEIIPINENDSNCKVLIMDDSYIESGYIGCLLDKYLDNLKAISKFLKEYKVSDQPYKPKFNEYCLATYENEWYRAKVVEILSEDKFLVVYIDFTNEMELTSKSIRRYPMSLTIPCCTTLCAINGLPEDISDELKNFLESNCKAFTSLNIDSVRIVEDIRYVESKELLKKLHDSKLL